MCGIFGYCLTGSADATQSKNIEKLGITLGLLNLNRGKDSWGVTDGERIVKGVGPIIENLHRIEFSPESGLLVGHTRAATVGSRSIENAHPFEFEGPAGRVVGVHNGGISNWSELNTKYGVKLEVDSMHIFRNIAMGLPLEEVRGSGAIVYLKDGVLYFSKFNGGSLSVARIPELGLVWSSERNHLEIALKAANLHGKPYVVEDDKLYYYGELQLMESREKLNISKRYEAAASTNCDLPNWRAGFHDHRQTARTDFNLVKGTRMRAEEVVAKAITGVKVRFKVKLGQDFEAQIRRNKVLDIIETHLCGRWLGYFKHDKQGLCVGEGCNIHTNRIFRTRDELLKYEDEAMVDKMAKWWGVHVCVHCAALAVYKGDMLFPSNPKAPSTAPTPEDETPKVGGEQCPIASC